MSNRSSSHSFGILYPGELGAALGQILALQGFEVFTALRGRSPATRERAHKAGMQDLGDVHHLLNTVDFVLSFVPPGAAKAVAATAAAYAAPQDRWTFVDFNSIGPDAAEDIARCLAEKGIDYVDGSIHGQARHLGATSTIYLSGPRSKELVELLGGTLRVYGLGANISAASQFKMLLAALSKSMVTTLLEVGIVASKADQLGFFLEQVRFFYPGLMEAVERMAPTYPQHAARRVEEMIDVERLISRHGLRPGIAAETRCFLAEFATAHLPSSPPGLTEWPVESLIEALAAARVLGSTGASVGDVPGKDVAVEVQRNEHDHDLS